MQRAGPPDLSACATCRADPAEISAALLTGTPDEQASDVRAYAEAGLDELMLSMPWRSLDDLAIEPPRVHARRRSPRLTHLGIGQLRATCPPKCPISTHGFSRGAS